jgi:hypothetical protein
VNFLFIGKVSQETNSLYGEESLKRHLPRHYACVQHQINNIFCKKACAHANVCKQRVHVKCRTHPSYSLTVLGPNIQRVEVLLFVFTQHPSSALNSERLRSWWPF